MERSQISISRTIRKNYMYKPSNKQVLEVSVKNTTDSHFCPKCFLMKKHVDIDIYDGKIFGIFMMKNKK